MARQKKSIVPTGTDPLHSGGGDNGSHVGSN